MNSNLLPTTSQELLELCNILFFVIALPKSFDEKRQAVKRYNEAARLYNQMTESNHIKTIKP
jgi:hypothetical protein